MISGMRSQIFEIEGVEFKFLKCFIGICVIIFKDYCFKAQQPEM